MQAVVGKRIWRAPAKVNLTLHVLGRREDGFHELDSLVAFAGVCDGLEFTPGEPLALEVAGPTAAESGPEPDNLVYRAARALQAAVPELKVGAFRLIKRLPVAAGLGGGSADAAAALRALAACNGLAPDDPRIFLAARSVGADASVCLDPRASFMRGIGERVVRCLDFPALPSVLVNPRVPVPTSKVFAALGLSRGATAPFGAPVMPKAGPDLFASLRAARNDLQGAAIAIEPKVREVLERLSRLEGVEVTRMSGSGATCFAIFADRAAAARGARRLRSERPDWWIRATYLR